MNTDDDPDGYGNGLRAEDVKVYDKNGDYLDALLVCANCGSTFFRVYRGTYLTAVECSQCGHGPVAVHSG